MRFNSKLEAMLFALMKLNQIKENYSDNNTISKYIEKIKEAFENHEQNMDVVCDYLAKIVSQISREDGKQVQLIISDISTSEYKQTPQERFENPLARRAESELFAHLLVSPTKLMMQSVNRISIVILAAIDILKNEDPKRLNKFLFSLSRMASPIACGAFSMKTPFVEEIEKILRDNNNKKLAEIMHIHFKFARYTSRSIPINAPDRSPVGKLAEIVKKYPGNFFEIIKQKNSDGKTARSYISDVLMEKSELYTYNPKKGRKGRKGRNKELRIMPTNMLSLLRSSQRDYESDLPMRLDVWVPDCRGQEPDFESPYVMDVINNDTPYVSGPSGMTNLLLGQMEFMANFENVALKQNYLNATAAYIVGAGFHSLHEVIGPAQYSLDLVPGYHVFVPGKLKSESEAKLPSSPQYNVFFMQQAAIDPQFTEERNTAWQRYLKFFENVYMPKHFPLEKAVVSDAKSAHSSLMITLADATHLSLTSTLMRTTLSKKLFFKQEELSDGINKISELTERKIQNISIGCS